MKARITANRRKTKSEEINKEININKEVKVLRTNIINNEAVEVEQEN